MVNRAARIPWAYPRGIAIGLGLLALIGSAQGQVLVRDGTRKEMVNRFCGRDAKCKASVKEEITQGKSVQGIILAVGESIYRETPKNAELAYDAMTRSLQFAHDFMSQAEMETGQVRFVGGEVETLREIFGQSVWICENRNNWLAKFYCMRRRIASFLPTPP